ncbi:polysaccharide biosynthesis/export family protein [soil metagenome]
MISTLSPTRALILGLASLLAGCSTLPRDGPTGSAVQREASAPGVAGNYAIVNLDYAASERIKALPPRFLGSLADGGSPEPGGRIGPGDTLAVSVFEPNGGLFSAGSVPGEGARASNQTLPLLVVSPSGTVTIPFGGAVSVAGLSTTEAQAAIRRALIGKVANPQVVVSVAENTFNTVTVLGEVRNPGRAPLTSNANTILDVIAARGGTGRAPEDVLVRLQRGQTVYTAPFTAVTTDFGENIRLQRGDQINLLFKPRRFSTFGAFGAVAQLEMGPGPLDLAGAISKVGGLDTNSANARSILIFRFERPEVAQALGITQPATARGVPVVYRLNLEEATGFFVANNFEIQPEDVLYVPRSGSAELGKFFTLVQTVTRVVYDVSVTSTLNGN